MATELKTNSSSGVEESGFQNRDTALVQLTEAVLISPFRKQYVVFDGVADMGFINDHEPETSYGEVAVAGETRMARTAAAATANALEKGGGAETWGDLLFCVIGRGCGGGEMTGGMNGRVYYRDLVL